MVIPVLKTTTESALELTSVGELPIRVLKVTGIEPPWSYWSATVLVVPAITLIVCGLGALPSLSTRPGAPPEGVSV